MGNIIVVSGAAGSGKGTVLGELFKMSDSFRYSVSFTSRKPRPGEVDGVNYFFVTREEFEERIKNGDFAEHVEYCGNYYGTSASYIRSLRDQGYNVVLEIETVGALNMMKAFPDSISIFLAPPSYTVLEQRLRGRGTETEGDIQKRLSRAKEEIQISQHYKYIVLNRDGEMLRAAQKILDICNRNAVSDDILISGDKQEFINTFLNN